MIRIVFISMIIVLLALVAGAEEYDENTLEVRCHWTAPSEGSAVAVYYLQVKDAIDEARHFVTYVVPAQAGLEQEYFVTIDSLRPYTARVRGMDSQGRQGPWSEWSPMQDFVAAPDP